MGQWKIEQLGVSSKDFAQGVDEKAALSGFGSKWKFADEGAKKAEAPAPTPAGSATPADPPKETTKYTEADLMVLSKAQLQEVAAGMGIADVSGSKNQLVQVILERQK